MVVLKSMRIALVGIVIGTAALSAQAETKEDMSFDGLMKMSAIDKNKDGMVSKQEFMDMMSKAWDHNAKQMKAKDRLNAEQFKQVLMYLKAGG